MELDVDYLINFFDKLSSKDSKEEMGEQDTATASPSSSSSGGGSTSNVPKWADSYPIKVGKANPRMKSGEKWETGLTRGAANQIW